MQPTESDASPGNGMSMADDHTLRSYRPNDPYQPAEPSRSSEQSGGGDPLAELARLIGQRDPFAEFGRSSARQGHRPSPDVPTTAPVDWQQALAHEPDPTADYRRQEEYETRQEYAHPLAPVEGHDDAPLAADYQDGHHDDRIHDGPQYGDRLQGGDEADPYYQDDVPLEPHEDEMYDDAPHARRRSGLVTALALIGCAVLGTAGAYAYRSYSGAPSSTQPPPVITADNSTPTKIIPATAGDPQSSKAVQDRLAIAEKEQLVSKQEEPVALSAPRGAPAASAPSGQAGSAGQPAAASEPKKVRTVTIRPDGSDVSGKPMGMAPPAAPGPAATATATARPAATPPAPRAAPPAARNGGAPISLEPQAGEPAAAPARARTAAIPPSAEGAASGFVVQLSSQKTESEAQSSFRSLQAKFPNELGSRQPIIRRADLGSKGVFYRTMIGPFASAQEASQFCATYKAAGGQCVVPNN
jgi:SPOR domain